MSEQAQVMMKRLFWRIWFANQRDFREPGIYYSVPRVKELEAFRARIEEISDDDPDVKAKVEAIVAERSKLKANYRIIPLWQSVARCNLIEFPEVTTTYAKDQPQYRPLPAHKVANDPQGRIIFLWKLNFLARLRVLFTGEVWHQVLTFNHPLQPQQVDVEKPDMTPAPAPEPQTEAAPASP